MSTGVPKKVSIVSNARQRGESHNGNMPATIHGKLRRPARIYLKEWLEFRGLTAEQLAGRLDTSKSVVSKLMNGKQRYNQDWLEMIAYALNVEVPALYRHPEAPTADELLRSTTPEKAREVFRVISVMLGTGTSGGPVFLPQDEDDDDILPGRGTVTTPEVAPRAKRK